MPDDRPKKPTARLHTDEDLDELRRKEAIAQLRKSITRKRNEYRDKVNHQLNLFKPNPNPE